MRQPDRPPMHPTPACTWARSHAATRRVQAPLKDVNSDDLIPMHCSGEPFIAIAMQEMPGKVLRSSTGSRLLFA